MGFPPVCASIRKPKDLANIWARAPYPCLRLSLQRRPIAIKDGPTRLLRPKHPPANSRRVGLGTDVAALDAIDRTNDRPRARNRLRGGRFVLFPQIRHSVTPR